MRCKHPEIKKKKKQYFTLKYSLPRSCLLYREINRTIQLKKY